MKLPPGYVPGVGVRRASAYGGVGERLLKGMGWQDGQGLGRSKKGIKSALEVKRKDDTAGVRTTPVLSCLLITHTHKAQNSQSVCLNICCSCVPTLLCLRRLALVLAMTGRTSGGRPGTTGASRLSQRCWAQQLFYCYVLSCYTPGCPELNVVLTSLLPT